MKLDIILEAMHRVPTANFALICCMAVVSGLMVSHILRAGPYVTFVSIPMLVLAGWVANAALALNNVALSHDKASNAALSASFGFIALASLTFIALRLWVRLRDKR